MPLCPPKQTFGNKDPMFLQDRMFYLQRFMRKVSKFEFIIESPEFQAFVRPPKGMKVEAAILAAQSKNPMSSLKLFERMQDIFGLTAREHSDKDLDVCRANIISFTLFV